MIRGNGWLFTVLLVSTAGMVSNAGAQTAAELHNFPVSDQCRYLMLNLYNIVVARDHGVPKAAIVERNKTIDSQYAVPLEAIDDVFDFPKLGGEDIGWYWSQACHARAHGLKAASLQTIEPVMRACPITAANSEDCTRQIRNAILGLPRDFVPKEKLPTAIQDASPAPPAPADKPR